MCLFVAALAVDDLCHSTIKGYLSAVRHLHIAQGFGDPHICEMARLEQVLRGVKKVQSKGHRRDTRLPVTPELLLKLREVWNRNSGARDNIMIWAAATLCFFGFMRAGELTVPSDSTFDESSHLAFQDIAVDSYSNPQMLKVRLKASKTDPFRVGVDVFVGRTGSLLCPVAAVLAYMKVRGAGVGPFFTFANGKPLTRTRFVLEVRAALREANVDCSRYSGHSFRIGAATTAARKGISDTTIKMLGRWKSSAYQLYIRTPQDTLARVSRRLVE